MRLIVLLQVIQMVSEVENLGLGEVEPIQQHYRKSESKLAKLANRKDSKPHQSASRRRLAKKISKQKRSRKTTTKEAYTVSVGERVGGCHPLIVVSYQ
jgi:hypothetical protein